MKERYSIHPLKPVDYTVVDNTGEAELGTWVIATFRWLEHAEEYCDALNEREKARNPKDKKLIDYFRPTNQDITIALKKLSEWRELLIRLNYGHDLKEHEKQKHEVTSVLYTIEQALIISKKD